MGVAPESNGFPGIRRRLLGYAAACPCSATPCYLQHSTSTVNFLVAAAKSASSIASSDGAVSWRTSSASRNAVVAPALMAKFTFCGMSPVLHATWMASSFATTTPTTLPAASSTGPPLLSGWTGANDLVQPSARFTACGSRSMILSSVRAGPVGLRRPLLPVLQGALAHVQECRHLRLRQPELLANGPHVRHGELLPAQRTGMIAIGFESLANFIEKIPHPCHVSTLQALHQSA